MKWKHIILTLFIIGIGIGGWWFYMKYEKPLQDITIQYSDVTIFSIDDKTRDKISIGYRIVNSLEKTGITSSIGDILEKAPVNATIHVESYNLEKQEYYSFISKDFFIEQGQSYRVEMKLQKPEKLTISHTGDLENENVVLTLDSKYYKNPIFCFKWSPNILRVKVNESFGAISSPEEYKNYDKCYQLGEDLDSIKTVDLEITTFSNLNPNDFLNVIIADRDTIMGNILLSKDGEDIGGENIFYEIRPFV